jgi:hypothetical protein
LATQEQKQIKADLALELLGRDARQFWGAIINNQNGCPIVSKQRKTMKDAKKASSTGAAPAQVQFKAVRQACVPLVAWESYDPAATITECQKTLKAKAGGQQVAVIAWDIITGLVGLNEAGKDAAGNLGYEDGMPLPAVLRLLQKLPGIDDQSKKAVVFLHQAHRAFDWEGVLQGIWLLRDKFKATGATLVLFWNGGKLPIELSHDVIEIKEVAPDISQLNEMVESLTKPLSKPAKDGKEAVPYPCDIEKTVDGLKGLLSMFDAEQSLALNMNKDGINVKGLWERKIARLKGSTGAEITIDNPSFSELSGCENVKGELQGFIDGQQRPGVVLFMDEIEKMFGGAGTDLSGTTTNMLGQWLTWTQERRVRGFLLAGIPGAGKSWTGACAAGQAAVPFFKLNISEAKGSLVGQSEQQMKSALNAVDAISGGNVLLIASCNWVDNLTPDVMGRFTMGTFFYDYPTTEERTQLILQYADKYQITESMRGKTFDEVIAFTRGWVGREIENACFKAWQYKRPFLEVAKNIAPSCISQRERLEKLRQSCSGRFLSANNSGLFKYEAADHSKPASGMKTEDGVRRVQFDS